MFCHTVHKPSSESPWSGEVNTAWGNGYNVPPSTAVEMPVVTVMGKGNNIRSINTTGHRSGSSVSEYGPRHQYCNPSPSINQQPRTGQAATTNGVGGNVFRNTTVITQCCRTTTRPSGSLAWGLGNNWPGINNGAIPAIGHGVPSTVKLGNEPIPAASCHGNGSGNQQ